MAPVDNPLEVFFDLVPTGAALYAPLHDAGGDVVDFRFVRLNPAGQRLLGLPAQPLHTLREQYPHSVPTGIFAQYRQAYLTGQATTYDGPYAGDGLDTYFRLVAQRSGDLLVVDFMGMADLLRSAVEAALREAQAAEQAARAEAQAQRQRLAEILRHLPAQVAAYHGPDHVYTFVNQLYQDYFPAQELLGRPVREAMAAAAGQGFFDLLSQVYHTGEPYYGVELPVNLDFSAAGRGQQVFINTCYHPLRNARGEIDGVLDFSYDVTEQVLAHRQGERLQQELEARVRARTQEAEAARMEAEHQRTRLVRLFEEAPAGICVLEGPELVFAFVNAEYQALFPGRALVGRPVLEALPELVDQPVPALLRGVYETGSTYQGREMRMQFFCPRTGKLEDRYFNFVYQARYDAANTVDGLVVFAFEITEQVRARQAVEASAHQLRLLTDALPVLIAYLDHTLIYRFVNQAYKAWLQRSPAEIVGTTPSALMSATAFERVHPYLRRALAGERVDYTLTMPYRPDSVKHTQGSFIPDVQHGGVVGFYSLVSDMTELVNARQAAEAHTRQAQTLAAELASTNERLVHTNVDLDNFIYTASHDLKAPIGGSTR